MKKGTLFKIKLEKLFQIKILPNNLLRSYEFKK